MYRPSLNAIYRAIAAKHKLYGRKLVIIQIGDLRDLFSHGKFPRSFNVMTPEQEIRRGTRMAAEMWATIRRIAPKATCIQMLGNHDERPLKRVLEAIPELESIIGPPILELYKFPGVELVDSEREELIMDKIMFMHGYRSKLGDHAIHNMMNTVCGHSHRGGVVWHRLGKRAVFEANAGYIGDPRTRAMSYTRQKKVSTWTQGYLEIDFGMPRFVALPNP